MKRFLLALFVLLLAGVLLAGQDGASPCLDAGLSVGRGSTGCWVGPFLRVTQQSFAQEETALQMTWDDSALYASFRCQEKCLDPRTNRVHEFKSENPSIWSNDYVILLFQRKGVFYDVVVDGGGRLVTASTTDTLFWAGRKERQETGMTSTVEIGNGFWTARIRIPWEAIGGKAELGEVFRFQAGRGNPSLQETSVLFPTPDGFHSHAYFGSLALVEQVPEVHPQLPQFLPGKNTINCPGASVSGWIAPAGQDKQLFHSKDFELTHSGRFQFCWQLSSPNAESYWISPVYELSTSATLLHFPQGNAVRLNGVEAVPGSALQDGRNLIEVKTSFLGTLQAGNYEFVPPAETFQLYSHHTLLWPNWQEKEWCVTRGGVQMLLFAPRGFPDTRVSDYTIKLNLPKGFTLECASGYYNIYPEVQFTPDGTITIKKEISYRKAIPSHEFLAAFIRVPEDYEGDVTELSFASSSPSQGILEVPQRVRVRLMPKLDGVAPKEMLIYIWGGWLHALTNKAYIDTVLKDFASAGINLIVNLPNQVIPYNCSFCFDNWSWPLAPFTKLHPETALVQKDGKTNPKYVCPKAIRSAEFAEWLKGQVPGWLEKSGNPSIVEWDYEYRVNDSPFSCYCPKCIDHTENAVRHQDMAFFIKLLRDALRQVNPKIRFAIYSGYQSERSKQIYGIDWNLLKGIVDIAECGYGRPQEDIQATRNAIGETPLVLGAIVQPYMYDDRKSPNQFTPAWLLRRAADSSYGILLYNYPSFDGKSMHAVAEASKIMSKYEPFFRFGKRITENVPGWPEADVQAIEYDGRKILLLMNADIKPRNYLQHAIPPGEAMVIEM